MKDIAAEIAQLRSLTRQQLLHKWQELHNRPAPKIRRELLVPFLAYKLQESAYGGLKLSTRAELRRIARALETGADPATPSLQSARPGTRIIRQWRGKRHEVLVTESGFEYCGARYNSLSKIARKITGTRWSGPAFFGIRKGSKGRGQSNE